jgi:hypothetical protein
MQEQGSRKPPPLVFIENRVRMACAQAVHGLAAHTPQYPQASTARFIGDGYPADPEHEYVCDQERRSHRGFVLAK